MLNKVCLINVGANSSHGGLRSPLFPDGTFELIPIPDGIMDYYNYEGAIRYRDLKASNGKRITELVRSTYHNRCAHYDPEFESFTYGDYPTLNPRAANLGKLSRGDFIFFFARLVDWEGGRFMKSAGFYLVGCIRIDKIHREMTETPPDGILRRIRNNAHVIRGECDPIFYDGFWVFEGQRRYKRFEYAIPLDREFIEACGILDAKSNPWKWHLYRSELSAIGSYMRSAKPIQDEKQLYLFWDRIKGYKGTPF